MEIISNHELLSPHRSEPHLDVGDDQMADRGSDSTRGYTSEEDSEEWEEDNVVVCEDWTLENDALGHLFDPDDCRCDRPLDMPGTLSMCVLSPRSDSCDQGHGATKYVLIPPSEYIMANLELFHAMCRIEDLDFIGMEVDAQETLMKSVVIEKYKLQEYILNEGDTGNDFFFIVSPSMDQDGLATVEVIKNGRTVTRLFCGQIFGEKNFLTKSGKRMRSASVRVVEEFNHFSKSMIILEEKGGVLCEANIKDVSGAGGDAEIAIARVKEERFPLWKRLRENMIVSRIPAFRNFSRVDLERLLILCEDEHFDAGDLIMKEGEKGSKMYFVLEGKLSVNRSDVGVIAKLHPGHCIGEMAVIFNEPRYATVVCLEQTTCLSLTVDAFNSACRMDHGFKGFIKCLMDKRKAIRKRRFELANGNALPSTFLSSDNASASTLTSDASRQRRVLLPVSPNSLTSALAQSKRNSSVESKQSSGVESKQSSGVESKNSGNNCYLDGLSYSHDTGSTPSSGPGPTESPERSSTPLGKEKETPARWLQTPCRSRTRIMSNDSPSSIGSALEHPVTITKTLTSRKTRTGQKVLNDKYTVIRSIGKGSFGEVVEVRDPADNTFAMKCLRRSLLSRNDMALTDIQREIAIMSKLRHPNIVALFEVIDDPQSGKIYLVQEYMESTLMPLPTTKSDGIDDAFARVKPIEPERCRAYFRDMVRGVAYLHSQNVVHRDIKPQNILISANGMAKIGDFGASVFTGGLLKGTYQGTPAFTAPELSIPKEFRERDFTCMPTIDVFAMGATLFYMATGSLPWSAKTQVSLAAKIRNLEPRFPPDMDLHLKHLLQRMLDKDYSTRITMGEIEQDDWVTKEGAEPLYQYLYSNGVDNKENELYSFNEAAAAAVSPTLTLGSSVMKNASVDTAPNEEIYRAPRVTTKEVVMATMDDSPILSGATFCPRTLIVLVRDPGVLADLLSAGDTHGGNVDAGASSGIRRDQEHLSRTMKATKGSLTSYISGMASPSREQKSMCVNLRKPPSPVGTFFWKRMPDATTQELHNMTTDILTREADANSYDSFERGASGSDCGSPDTDEVAELLSGEAIDSEFERMIEASEALRMETYANEWCQHIDFPAGLPHEFSLLKSAPQGSFRGKLANFGLKSIRSENLHLSLRVGLGSNIGNRAVMEDHLLCAPTCNVPYQAQGQEFKEIALLGVFDGHGDQGLTAELLSRRTETVFLSNLADTCENTEVAPAECHLRHALEDTIACLEIEALFEIHARMKEANTFKTHAARAGGSTATILTISRLADSTRLLMVGCSVGDSIAVISRDGSAVVLSEEHRLANNEGERSRVLAAGGEITKNRIYGDLQLSRSIGDLNYKGAAVALVKRGGVTPTSLDHDEVMEIIEPMWAQDQVIISKPSFWQRELDPNVDEFIILASDGLFDQVTPQDAVNFVRFSLLNNQDLQQTVQELMNLAIQRARFAADNIGILIIALNQTERLDKH